MTSMETMTSYTVQRMREQNHDPIIAEEEAATAKDPQSGTG